MKYLFSILLFFVLLTPVSAQTTIPPEQVTPANGWACQDAGMGLGRNCTHTDGRTASCRTVSVGGVPQETCTVSGAPTSNEEETTPAENPSPTTLPQNSTTPTPSAITPTGSEFVPLTSIPAIENINAEDGLSGFFNYLYVLAVGAAAVIAVLQFVRAGILYAVMNTGVVEKREARHLMLVSILGLLLVLSPALVFGIINPDILSLRIGDNYGSGISQTNAPTQGIGDPTSPQGGTVQQYNLLVPNQPFLTLDDECDFKADEDLLRRVGIGGSFLILAQIRTTDLGYGNANKGRQCCAAASGTLGLGFGDGTSGVEMCDFNDTLIDQGRYAVYINARGTIFHEGKPVVNDIDLFTPGIGPSGVPFGSEDVDTIALHGFVTESQCNTFLRDLTNESLLDIYKNRKVVRQPGVGLLEGKRDELIDELEPPVNPDDLLSIESFSGECRNVPYDAK